MGDVRRQQIGEIGGSGSSRQRDPRRDERHHRVHRVIWQCRQRRSSAGESIRRGEVVAHGHGSTPATDILASSSVDVVEETVLAIGWIVSGLSELGFGRKAREEGVDRADNSVGQPSDSGSFAVALPETARRRLRRARNRYGWQRKQVGSREGGAH